MSQLRDRAGGRRRNVAIRLAVCAAVAAVVFAGACKRNRTTELTKPAPPVFRGRVPEYAEVADAYNKRVEPLSRLWTRGTVRVWYPDKQGEEETVQIDANLQYIRPDQVNLTLMHVGKVEPIAVLGSNDQRYWYIDLGDHKVARVGEHAKATQEAVAELGLPVYPLDLIELLGISPLPTSWPTVGTGEEPDLRWSEDGRLLILTTQGRTGWRRLYLDPDGYLPRRVELVGAGGKVLVSSELSDYQDPVGGSGSPMPFQTLAVLESGRVRVRMRFDRPELTHTIKPVAFDLDRLLQAYSVRDVRSLDEEARAGR